MAQYLGTDNRKFDIPDGQPGFEDWLAADSARKAAWDAAANDFYQYRVQHGTKPTTSACDDFFMQWMTAVGAIEVK